MRDKIALFRKKVMIHEKKIRELKKTLVRKQDKNAFFETDLTRFRQEFRDFFSSFIITDKKLMKFINFVVFIESDDLRFED